MLFLISLILALVFAVGCRKVIKKHPVWFYTAAAVLSLAAAVFPSNRMPFLIFSRASFATGLWAIVMWIGALPNGSKGIKALMPIRGELSIIASILTLGHNIGFGRTYFVRMFTGDVNMPGYQRAAGVLSLFMLLIMIPLTVISFPKVRRKMDPRRWKQVQRLAYLFYDALYLHVMLLTYPQARMGRSSARLSVLVYSLVFISYAVMRVRKYLVVRKKLPAGVKMNSVCAAVFAVLTAALVVPAGMTAVPVAAVQETAEVSEEISEPEESDAAEESSEEVSEETSEESQEPHEESSEETSEEAEESSEEVVEESSEEAKEETSSEASKESKPESKPAASEAAAESKSVSQAASQPAESKSAESTPASSEAPAPSEAAPEPQSVYIDGSYSASAYGYDGTVTVTVTISGDRITSISASSGESDLSYFNSARDTVISRIVSSQSAGVDGVSGATYSSNAIKQAVSSALAQAKR